MSSEAGPSQLSPRQKAKSPERKPISISPQDINLDDRIDQDIALLFTEWLESKSYHEAAKAVEGDVLGVKRVRNEVSIEVERALLDGDYGSLENLLGKEGILKPQAQKSFLYLCYRQQFLEFIENRESQKAFNTLSKRLKPLEHYQPIPYDFYNLAYLTSAGSVHDAPGLKEWSGEALEREKLVGMWREMMKSVTVVEKEGSAGDSDRKRGSRGRLVELLKQAGAWQVMNARRRGDGPWTLNSLMDDFQPLVIPSWLKMLIEGHKANIKCLDHLGPGSHSILSGSSDGTLRISSTTNGSIQHILSGHTSRIWDCALSPTFDAVASGSGDGTIRIWSPTTAECKGVMYGDGGDVYSISWRPGGDDQIASASYDRILRVWDVETSKQIRTFSGHTQSTLAVDYDDTGKLLASGGKDKQIRLWDAIGGMCVQTLADCLGEITSVEFDREGKYLLAGCKDNSNRLFDLRMQRNIYRYTGNQNTSKNLIRSHFGSNDQLVISGSEDGLVYIWPTQSSPDSDSSSVSNNSNIVPPNKASPAYYPPRDLRQAQNTSTKTQSGVTVVKPIRTLEGHGEGAVFDVVWTEEGVFSAGEDGMVGVWGYDPEDEA